MDNRDAGVHSQHRAWDPVALPPHRWLLEGATVGFVGGAAVALWFLLLDALTRVPLYTPAALGSVLFFGATGPQEVHRTVATIGGYTIVHFGVFVALGALFTWMVDRVQSTPRQWLIMVLAFILLDGLFAGTVAMIGEWAIQSIGVWAVAIGNLVAVVVMGAMVWLTHPQLRRQFAAHAPVHTSV